MEKENSFKEFRKKIKKVSEKRIHKIKNSYGIADYFTHYRKIRPQQKSYVLSRKQFDTIHREVNEAFAQLISEGVDIKLPYRMGLIELREYQLTPTINKEGKLLYGAPIDWESTYKLWYEDEVAFKDKVLIKSTHSSYPSIKYNKFGCNYRNKSFYKFKFNRDLVSKTYKKYFAGELKILFKK